jgi:hypothetical protein
LSESRVGSIKSGSRRVRTKKCHIACYVVTLSLKLRYFYKAVSLHWNVEEPEKYHYVTEERKELLTFLYKVLINSNNANTLKR